LHSLTYFGQPMTTQRLSNNDRWDDKEEAASQGGQSASTPAFQPLTREEAQALRAKQPLLNPWRVIGVQAAVGVMMTLLVAAFAGEKNWAWSVLYGAATVVVPGALMARGMTSPLSKLSLGASLVSVSLWEMVKMVVSVAMLMLAPKIVPHLSWPALLVGLLLCMKVYVVAMLWFSRQQSSRTRQTSQHGS
jgi:ATP synthase protein I